MKRAANPSARSRPRKKSAAPALAAPTPANVRNVAPGEGTLSVAAGVLLVIAAIFPRSLKQFVLLSLGGGLLYRGVTGHCGVYQALDIDTAKRPLLEQINEKLGD